VYFPASFLTLLAAVHLGAPPPARAVPLDRPARADARATVGDPAPAAARRVARAVAERWKVSPERIRLEWESPVTDDSISPGAAVELWGSGAGGHWTVIFHADSGASPVRARVRAGVETQVAVATHALARDVVLSDADIATSSVVLWGAPQDSTELPAAGWVTRRVIAAGEQLREPAVSKPALVKAGAGVTIEWRRGTVALSMRGTAAGSASLGESVWVRTENGHRLQGVVAAPALVRID
jgi:flagella basal body P-ring formation protein FlgA